MGERLHLLVAEGPLPPALAAETAALARTHASRMGGVNTRAFVQAFSQLLDL